MQTKTKTNGKTTANKGLNVAGDGNEYAKPNGKTMLLEIPLNTQPRQSSTGKTMLVATWRGSLGFTVNGREVHGSVMAYYYPNDKE